MISADRGNKCSPKDVSAIGFPFSTFQTDLALLINTFALCLWHAGVAYRAHAHPFFSLHLCNPHVNVICPAAFRICLLSHNFLEDVMNHFLILENQETTKMIT